MDRDEKYGYTSPKHIRRILTMYYRLSEAAKTGREMTALAIVIDIDRAIHYIKQHGSDRQRKQLNVVIDRIVKGESKAVVMQRYNIGRMTCWRYERAACRTISTYLTDND